MSLLDVTDLTVEFGTPAGVLRAVDGISFTVDEGEVVGLVGESGSGKSATALAVAGLLDPGAVRGSVRLGGRELLDADGRALRTARGRELAMVFQDPATSLNPVRDIVDQVAEMYRTHLGLGRAPARARAVEALREVGIDRTAERYPHQLSGGMRQRVMIAMAVACGPRLLLADEPTTALDVTVQAQVLDLLTRLSADRGTSLLLIGHDLGVIAGTTSRVLVTYAGRIVETGPTDAVFAGAHHPYTAGLLASVPRLDRPAAARLPAIPGAPPDPLTPSPGCAFAPRCPHVMPRCRTDAPPLRPVGPGRTSACWLPVGADRSPVDTARVPRPRLPADRQPVVVARDLTVELRARRTAGAARAVVRPVDGVDLTIGAGETLGLVGESGCGKSTLGRALLMLRRPTAGEVRIAGRDWADLRGRDLRRARRHAQLVFQDPLGSFDPRVRLRAAVAEALPDHSGVDELFRRVRLDPGIGARYPHECSGGQLQRVALARALAVSPGFVVADEPTSSLDVSVQARIVNLMCDLQDDDGPAYLFVSHDLAVVRQVSHRVAVMYLGRIVETAGRDALFTDPLHPYTRALLAAVPIPDPPRERLRPRIVVRGEVPTLVDPPPGCRFHPRCPEAMDVCRWVSPGWTVLPDGHGVACHLYP